MAKKRNDDEWEVKRIKSNQATITLPKGMTFTSDELKIEDIIEAVKRHSVIQDGNVQGDGTSVVVKCCGGNTAIA